MAVIRRSLHINICNHVRVEPRLTRLNQTKKRLVFEKSTT
jgi:hypothetical protein